MEVLSVKCASPDEHESSGGGQQACNTGPDRTCYVIQGTRDKPKTQAEIQHRGSKLNCKERKLECQYLPASYIIQSFPCSENEKLASKSTLQPTMMHV